MEELNKRNYPLSELIKAVSVKVLAQWDRANHLFKPPIICTQRSLERRLQREWERAKLAANKKMGKAHKEEFD